MSEKKDNKKKRFKLFDLQKEGKGVSKRDADQAPDLKGFFISYKNNFGKLVSVNIFYILGNFPILALIAALSGVSKNSIFLPLSDLFQNINGIISADGGITPYKMALYALEGLQSASYAPTAWTYVLYAISALTLITFGLVNVGTAYIIRNMVSGEPVFVWYDFWYAVKRNWKQALPFGVLDAVFCVIPIFNVVTLLQNGNFLSSLFFWSNVVIFIVYFFMRYYIYIQMVTFKLSVFKIIKNSLIFALVGFKRNITALIGIVILLFLEVLLLFGTGGILIPIAVAAPLAILFSTFAFMKVYASYFKVKEIMIDPYLAEHPELARKPSDDEEIIMRDDVTERERLEEIKRRNGIQD